MKNEVKVLLLVALCSLGLLSSGCKPQPSPNNQSEPIPVRSIAIIKLNQGIENGIVVTPTVLSSQINYHTQTTWLMYGDSLSLCNTMPASMKTFVNFAQEEMAILNSEHYILLNNGYAIVSWKWHYFNPLSAPFIMTMDEKLFSPDPSYNNGFIENEEFYLLPKQYRDLTTLYNKWSLDEGKPIDMPDIRYISYRKLDEYRQDSLKDTNERRSLYEEGINLFHCYKLYDSNDTWQKYVAFCDSMETIYIQTINEMINRNDLELWTMKFK